MLWNDLRTRTNRLDFGIDPDMTQDQFFHFSALTDRAFLYIKYD